MPHRHKLNKLDYHYVPEGQPLPDPESFRIQASGISDFIYKTNAWYREKILGEKGFEGSTSSVSGTAVHWAAQCYIMEGTISPENKQEMYDYMDEQQAKFPDQVDAQECRNRITPMWQALREYINQNPGGLCEPMVEMEVLPGITVGGSIDRIKPIGDTKVYTDIEQLRGKTVEIDDWKTTSKKYASEKTITQSDMSTGYEWQLLVYAYVLKKKYDITVLNMRDVFITREHPPGKTKSYPATVVPIHKPVTQESLDFIESIIELVAYSVREFVINPPYRYLLAQDMRLKDNNTILPFAKMYGEEEEI